MACKFLHKTTMKYPDSSHRTLWWITISPQWFALLCTFLKGASKSPLSGEVQKRCAGVYELAYHCGSPWSQRCGLSGWSWSGHTWCVSLGKDIGFLYPTPQPSNINYIDAFVIDSDDKAHTWPPTGAGILLTAGMKGDKEEVWQAMMMMITTTGNRSRRLTTSLVGK